MPAPQTVDEFLDLVRKSQLVDIDALDEFLIGLSTPPVTPADVARLLAAAGMLTSFHVDQLLKGKHRGFFLGKYKLLERIGMGGMGQVFLAEHGNLKRRAAVKVLPPDLAANEYSKQRFLREARAAGQLNHPNLVRAFDVDTDGDVAYLVMEYIEGISLHDLVVRYGPLDPARAAYYLWQAANGLEYIQTCGLVHRDIKPANLLVDRAGVVKILDLGLARSLDEDNELTRGQGVKLLGTADYLAPEQAIDCSSVDIRADIYSLGSTGYFMLTGEPPYPGDKMGAKLVAHQTKPVPRLSSVRPGVISHELSEIIAKMMAKRPADRFQTPTELAAALESWAHSPPPPLAEEEIMDLSLETPSAVAGKIHTPSPAMLRNMTSSHAAVMTPPPQIAMATSPLPPSLSGEGPIAMLKKSSSRPAPPLLPASHTHGLGVDPNRDANKLKNPFKTASTSEHKAMLAEPTPARKRIGLTIGVFLSVFLAVWTTMLVSGAVTLPGVAKTPQQKSKSVVKQSTTAGTSNTRDTATR